MIKARSSYLYITLLFTVIFSITEVEAQNTIFRKPFFGQIINMFSQQPLKDAHIINLTTTKGTISNYRGEFRIDVSVGDTLYFSEMGFHSKKLIVVERMLEETNIIKLVTQNYKLQEVVVTPHNLTGILEVDVKSIVGINERRVVKIGGLRTSSELKPNLHDNPTVFQPVDFIYNIFGSRPKELRKLKKLEEQDQVKNLLYQKYDREFLMETMNLSRQQIESILKYCDYDPEYVSKANDLQVLQAVLQCYEQYKEVIDKDLNK